MTSAVAEVQTFLLALISATSRAISSAVGLSHARTSRAVMPNAKMTHFGIASPISYASGGYIKKFYINRQFDISPDQLIVSFEYPVLC
jgi:hypothetical protein